MKEREQKEISKCDFSRQYTVEIASTTGVRLNDECYVRPLYGDFKAFIKQDGELVLTEIPTSEPGHENVYCNVTVEDVIVTRWGSFNQSAVNDPKLSANARKISMIIKKSIRVDPKLNGSGRRPSRK